VQEVESFIDRRIAEVSASVPAADQQLVTLLALLNVAEGYLALQKGENRDCGDLMTGIDRISARIDMALGEGKLPES
jgi:cell division protein ZapA